ncbi:uncharacterized protein MELLADRAFT_118565 [Melampsora larici-populina 98AG31]|uniref:Uncharacterized protein n=1 Tax=Melampsora larici-populina (strain 98AG31 / pathotype 3-4-7) TaxID=747676 RepID=F4SAM3_MELLP|nr:uncharacterized protein MELLADRAFT_118565 [Melampsora larici-populina 98AG31]EGF98291.1 hypothetical protein MELLADRAFT_118565 [Melampsora larici-populina 98AG31]
MGNLLINTHYDEEPPKGTTEWFKIVMNDVVLSVDESDELMHSLKSFRTIISDELIRKTIDLCKMPKIPTYSLLNSTVIMWGIMVNIIVVIIMVQVWKEYKVQCQCYKIISVLTGHFKVAQKKTKPV